MDWIRVDTSLPDHYKLGRMGQDEDAELGRIIRFWVWAKRVCTSGCLSGLSDSEIERHAKLPDGWLARARIAGFVDGEPNDSSVHGWLDFQGADARTAALAAERQRAHRKRKSVTLRHGGALRTETVDRQDRTRQDKTRQDKSLSAPAQPSPGPAVISLPLKGGGAYGVTEEQVASWSEAYPGIDVLGELHRMVAWLAANPGRVKTGRGTPRFVVAWLGRAEPQTHSSNGTSTNKIGRQAGGNQPRDCLDARPDGAWAWLEPARDVFHAQTMLGMAEDAAKRLERLYGPVGWYYDCAWDAVKHWRAEVARLTPAEVR